MSNFKETIVFDGFEVLIPSEMYNDVEENEIVREAKYAYILQEKKRRRLERRKNNTPVKRGLRKALQLVGAL